MTRSLKRLLFKALKLETYLLVLQRSFFILYRLRVLKLSSKFSCNYLINDLITEGDVVIDIGANLGYYTIPFARLVGKTGIVHAVEPVQTFGDLLLRAGSKYENIVIHRYALGQKDAAVTMVENSGDGYLRTGLAHVSEDGAVTPTDGKAFSFAAQMKIASELFADLQRIDYIKCDIEGSEYTVLSDMKSLIDRHRPIVQAEVWGNNETEVLRMFEDMGYGAYKCRSGKLVPDLNAIGDFYFLDKNIHSRYIP